MRHNRTVLAALLLLWLCAAATATARALVHVRGVPEVSVADYADGRPSRTLVALGAHTLALNRSALAAPHYATLVAAAHARRTVTLAYEPLHADLPIAQAVGTSASGKPKPAGVSDGAVDVRIESVELAEDGDFDIGYSNMTWEHLTTRTNDAAREEADWGSGTAEHVRLLVLLVEIEGMKAQSCTRAQARTAFWEGAESVAAFWAEASRGHVSLARDSTGAPDADVAGPFRLRATSTSKDASASTDACDAGGWRDGALAAARAAGVATWRYQHVAVVLPPDAPCGWLGLANVGCGAQCYLWVKQCGAPLIIAHELGHNFGLEHAAARAHETGAYVEYGDPTGVMGNRFLAQGAPRPDLNAAQLAQRAWLAPAQLRWASPSDPEYAAEGASVTYRLAPLDALPEALDAEAPLPQALVVVNPATQSRFYFAYRADPRRAQPLRVLVHKWLGTYYPTELVDVLAPGAVYADRLAQLTVRVDAVTPASAVLRVAFACVRRPPVVRVVATYTSSGSGDSSTETIVRDIDLVSASGEEGNNIRTVQSVLPRGAPLNYTVHITNADSGVCLPDTFRVRAWADALDLAADADTLQLAPGDTCTVHLAAAWRVNAGVAAIDVQVARVLPRTFPAPNSSSDSSSAEEEEEENWSRVHIDVAAPPESCTDTGAAATVGVQTLPRAGMCVFTATEGKENSGACTETTEIELRMGETLRAGIELLGTGTCGARDVAQRYRVAASLNSTTCPGAASVALRLASSDTVTLSRGTRVVVPLDVVAAAEGVPVLAAEPTCTVDVTLQALAENTEDGTAADAAAVLHVPLVVRRVCPAAPPLTVSPLPALEPRRAVWTSVRLFGTGGADADAAYDGCAYNVTAPEAGTLPAGVQVLASTARVTVRNGTAAVRVLVAASDRVPSAEVRATVRVGTADVPLHARIEPLEPACVRGAVVPLLLCSARAVAPGERAGGTCVLRVAHTDSWPCAPANLAVLRPVLSPNYTLDGISDDEEIVAQLELAPGEYTVLSFGFTRITPLADGNDDEEERVDVEVRVHDAEDGAGATVASHNVTARTSVDVGACVRRPPEVVLETPAPTEPVFAGAAVSATVAVRSRSSAHCRAETVTTATHTNSTTVALSQQPPRTFALAGGAARSFTIVAYDERVTAAGPNASIEAVLITFTATTAETTVENAVYDVGDERTSESNQGMESSNENDSSESSNVESSSENESSNVESSSENESSNVESSSETNTITTTVETLFYVDGRCVLGDVGLELLPYDGTLDLGPEGTVEVALNVSNRDAVGTCAGAVASVALGGTAPVGLSGTISPGTLTLAPGAWALAHATLHTRTNLPGGTYRASFSATPSDRPRTRAATQTAALAVACPAVPAAPRDITATQTTPRFGARTVAALAWRACDTAAACCCPCTYAVYRDGARVATTTAPAFRDTLGLARGRTYNYTVATVDARGARSPPACVAVLLVPGAAADRAELAALVGTIVACVLVAVVTAVAVVCIVRWDRVRPRLLRARALCCARRYATAADSDPAALADTDDAVEIVDLATVPPTEDS